YFAAGKAAQSGLKPFVDQWTWVRNFVSPERTELVTGFSYGPIMAIFFKGLYQISYDNVAVFTTLWKLFLAVVFIVTGWVVYRLLQMQETKISRISFLVFWVAQPLLLFEVLVNGHFDIIWLLFVLLAVWAAARHRWWLVIPLLIAGIWIKFIPILVTPFFVVWWWQETTRSTWVKQIGKAALGFLLGIMISATAWHGLWRGFKVLVPIISQSKWATTSVFAVTYYSFRPAFDWLFKDQAHWFLTRFVQGGLLVAVVYLLWPYLKKMILVLLKKYSMTLDQYIQMIFFSLFVYLSIWQKSFWPWYAVWIIPLGVLAYDRSHNFLLGRLLMWLSLAPLSFYPIWLFNYLARGSDAVGELWFQWLFVVLVWAYPLYIFVKLRKENFSLYAGQN
ncbi:MAG: hypothetical protein AAB740_03380, partial [Patescibacteria group bacterium]